MAGTDPDHHGMTMLYVEDDPDSLITLSEIIRYRYPDMQLLVADNGASGLEMFKRHLPEIVVTDINMPIINGIGMANEIKSINPSVKIIALTAFSDTKYLLQAIEIGFDHYILKPVDVENVFTVIDNELASIRSQQLIARQRETIQDLNDQLIQKAAQLECSNQELAAKNQDLESFNYTVAHDLRSPMVSVSGYSQLLLEMNAGKLDELSEGYLQIILQEITHMNSLIGALLKFSQSSLKQIEKKWFNLSKIANEIKGSLLQQDSQRTVTFQIADGIHCYGDTDLLRIVLENLLGNAWKYSAKKKSPLIEFGTITGEEDIVYFVRDNGVGFNQQLSTEIFSPFKRATCVDDFAGFGVGLATVKRIVERHGGRIWCKGEKGKGATFYFVL